MAKINGSYVAAKAAPLQANLRVATLAACGAVPFPKGYLSLVLQRAFLTVNLDQNGAEAGAGAVGLYGDQVLVVIRSDLQLPAVTLGVAAGHGLIAFIVVVPLTVRAMVSAGAAA